ncbi:hypothetical protein M6D81_24305 [Paenibacillus sp. J5C_2022]|nr:hypothetical protein [Paenibacillus sp. J5C2022]
MDNVDKVDKYIVKGGRGQWENENRTVAPDWSRQLSTELTNNLFTGVDISVYNESIRDLCGTQKLLRELQIIFSVKSGRL